MTVTGKRYSPYQGGAGALEWGPGRWVWWQRCRSAPAGCLWTEGSGGCAPVGLGCALVGRFKMKGRAKRRFQQLKAAYHAFPEVPGAAQETTFI